MYIEQKYLLLASSQLQGFKKKGDNLYNFRCPYCGDSQKNKSKARGFFFPKENNLIYKCHNCGKGASLKNFLMHLDPKLCNDYIFEKYRKDEKPVQLKYEQPKYFGQGAKSLKSIKKVSSLKLDHPVRQWITERKIPSQYHYLLYFAPKFYQWVNTIIENKFPSLSKDHPRLVIPFFENNNMFALQGRAFGNEEPKYITIKIQDKEKIYGLERVDWKKTVYVCEGPLDSLFVENCIATAQSDLRIPHDGAVLIPDNEPRNLEIVKQIRKYVEEDYSVVLWPDYVKEKDINEMIIKGKTRREIKTIIDEHTYSGLNARIKFAKWSKIND